MGASYTSTVLSNYPVSVLKLQIILIESVRDGVTKLKLADDFILRDLNFTVSQTEDQSSRICSPCSNKVRSTWAEFSIIKTSTTMIAFERTSTSPHGSAAGRVIQ